MGNLLVQAIFPLIIILLSAKSVINSANEEDKYTFGAAVVEYHPVDNSSLTPEERLEARTKSFIDLLKQVELDLDIIVFPESVLTPFVNETEFYSEVPKPFEVILCNSTDKRYKDYLKELSCAAVKYNTTIVVNTVEKENCTSNNSTGFCPSSGIVLYNTNVAFDRNGFVSGRYRKWNLYGEYQLSVPPTAELVTITTKNNNTFGIFTCFDILFNVPALNLTRDLAIKNIIFPTHWFSELPYLTALQTQQMWAHENNVNLLAAGGNNPRSGSGGSGIFIGEKGPLATAFIGGVGGTIAIAKKVPRLDIPNNPYLNMTPIDENVDELAKNLDSVKLIVDKTLNRHTNVVVNTNKSTIIEEVCNGELSKLCCQFNITVDINETIQGQHAYVYQMVVFSGIRSYNGGTVEVGLELCGVIACLNDSLSSCGQRYSNYEDIVWPITFKSISISATFPDDLNRIQYPNSLLSSLRPILPRHTIWKKEKIGGRVVRTHILNEPQNRVLTFGIFGRDFNRDSTVSPNKSAELQALSFPLVLSICLILHLTMF
ncbi:vanin-like protein 3 isoform X2 [Leptinotarsa decemlineata]